MAARKFFAWTRVNHRGTPSGRLHAVAKSSARSVCGRTTAGAVTPHLDFDGGHEFACGDCTRILGPDWSKPIPYRPYEP